jgi:subtilisin family serine protease
MLKAKFTYGGVPLNLSKSKTKAAIQYTRGAQRASRRGVAPPPVLEGFEMVSAARGIDKKLDQLRARPEVAVGTHVWTLNGDETAPLIPTGNLYIEFIVDSDIGEQHALLDRLFLSIKEAVAEGAFRVCASPQSPNPIKCAIALQKSKIVLVAEPEFATLPAERAFVLPAGAFGNTQWHLENTGRPVPMIDMQNGLFDKAHFKPGADAKIRAAWSALKSLGAPNIKIAVIDTGFALDHPQLRGDGAKIRNPYNAGSRNADVSPFFQYGNGSWGVASHGTSCAAVAAGALDAQGVLGAAPNARIIPIKLDVLSDEAIKNAFEHALLNGADIISCSLGYPQPVPLSTYIRNYLTKIAREGRGGRGIPMFFAAGNANPASNYQPRQISDFAAYPEGICVTASNSLDQRSSYSFFGANAHLCAPTNGDNGAGITTATVELTPDGRTATLTYTSGFGGTSSAAPLCAGIGALMLSANPNLTAQELKTLLRRSADPIGPPGTYNADGHSAYYGYGRVNALRAVQMAAAQVSGTSPGAPPPTTSAPKGRVSAPTLNVRSGPSAGHPKIAELAQGAEVFLIARIGNWWRIGNEAFVSADYIQPLGTSPRKASVASKTLNVRAAPSVAARLLATLRLGDVVDVLESSPDGWMRIGDGRWVLGKYLR